VNGSTSLRLHTGWRGNALKWNVFGSQSLLQWNNRSKWRYMMVKNVPLKALIAAGLIAVSSMAIPTVAEAKTRIGIYFGVPFYDGSIRNGYLYDPNYGWYAPEYRYRVQRYYGNSRVSCSQASRHIRNSGYRNVRTIDCSGRYYQFRATRNGRNVTLSYNARTRNFSRI
jgi:hypothetical protein